VLLASPVRVSQSARRDSRGSSGSFDAGPAWRAEGAERREEDKERELVTAASLGTLYVASRLYSTATRDAFDAMVRACHNS